MGRRRQAMEKTAVAAGNLVGPTAGPLNTVNKQRHRYELNMALTKDGTAVTAPETAAQTEETAQTETAPTAQTETVPTETETATDAKSEEKAADEQGGAAADGRDDAETQEPPQKKQRTE